MMIMHSHDDFNYFLCKYFHKYKRNIIKFINIHANKAYFVFLEKIIKNKICETNFDELGYKYATVC
jgi:hypothetical protein